MKDAVKIFCDGGARGNPGPAASAYVVEEDGKIVNKKGIFLGKSTNNVAEYTAVYHALKYLTSHLPKYKSKQIEFYLDSQLVVSQLNGIYKIKKDHLKKIYLDIQKLYKDFDDVSFYFVYRYKNKLADTLVNETLDLNES